MGRKRLFWTRFPITNPIIWNLVLTLAVWRALARGSVPPLPPYSKRAALLTPAELRFYKALLAAVPPGLIVFIKVRFMDVVMVPAGGWR